MAQEGASYLTQDSGFGVPIILSAENLDEAFPDPSESGDVEPLIDESDEAGQGLSRDIAQEEDVFDVSSNHDIVSMDNGLDGVIENIEDQEEEDSNVGQTQNLKVIYLFIYPFITVFRSRIHDYELRCISFG